MSKDRDKYDFSKFKLNIYPRVKAPINESAYTNRWRYRFNNTVANDFTLDKILEIIRSGDLEQLRELSRYFYRVNGEYRNNIDFLASLPLYDTVVIPLFSDKGSKTQMIKAFENACKFVDNLDVPNTFNRITKEWLKVGIYFGLLREDGEQVVIQDLPLSYCRTRFKDFHNLNILEFNLQYFYSINDLDMRAEAISSFPEIIQKAWKELQDGKISDFWIMVPPEDGGVCFCFSDDQTPLLVGSIPQLKKLDDAISREEKRDENELCKLLIQQMPIDNNGELVFQLDEVAEIHSSIAKMLSELDTVDVLTTFGDTKLESLQQTTAAAQSTDRIDKYKKNAYDALGRSSIIFNADGSSTLAYSIKKDEALMISYLNVYENWIKFLINERFTRPGLTFDFEILPTTVFNKKDLQSLYFSGAQYGYSKMFAGVSIGIKQRDQLSLMVFENEFLHMSEKMIPLQSSYTTSGTNVANEEKKESSVEKTTNSPSSNDINNKGGRPALADEDKSEKTQANIKAAG